MQKLLTYKCFSCNYFHLRLLIQSMVRYVIMYSTYIIKLKEKQHFHTCGIKCDTGIDYPTAPRQIIDFLQASQTVNEWRWQ